SKKDIDSFLAASGKKEFSHRIIICTSQRPLSKNLEKPLQNQTKPVNILTVYDLEKSSIDWSKVHFKEDNYLLENLPKKQLKPHQKEAVEKVIEGFKQAERGKLIMACGTGKTFTALKIAEKMVGEGGLVLFLVPSIALISQAWREWIAESEIPLHTLAVCSDTKVGRNSETEDTKIYELPLPVTTESQEIVLEAKAAEKHQMTVIFSTYHSIDRSTEAQLRGLPEFDLIIC
ncbi:MAG: DEAD/DEAH box helicase family protein, partial [Geminocystis sp.]|nr:DEAD/DEAH box helicase family protein [Geminocystis sp.]